MTIQNEDTLPRITLMRMLPVAGTAFGKAGAANARAKAFVAGMYVWNEHFASDYGQSKVTATAFTEACKAELAKTGNATESNRKYITQGKAIGYDYSEKIAGAVRAYLNDASDNKPRTVTGVLDTVRDWYQRTFASEEVSELAMKKAKKDDDAKAAAAKARLISAINGCKDTELLRDASILAELKANVLDVETVLTTAQRATHHAGIADIVSRYKPTTIVPVADDNDAAEDMAEAEALELAQALAASQNQTLLTDALAKTNAEQHREDHEDRKALLTGTEG